MNKDLQNYLDSFTFPRKFWISLVIDALTITLITFLILGFGALLNQQAYAISGGKGIEQLKLDLLSGEEQLAQNFLSQVRIFSLLLIGGSLAIFLLLIVIFSYSRQLVWEVILQQRLSWKPRWRWNGLTLILLVFLGFYLLFFAFLKMTLNTFLVFTKQTSAVIFSQSVNAFFFLIFILFVFLAYYSFAQKKKVWESIGNVFHLLKSKWASLGKMFLLVVITGLIVSFISYYFQKELLFQPQWIKTGLSAGILLLFLSWMRLYVVRTVT